MAVYGHRIVICIAPVGHNLPAGVRNPIAARDLAAAIVEAEQAGASMVHLHVRDKEGKPTADTAVFRQTLDIIRERSEIIVQASTGGEEGLDQKHRSVSIEDPRIEVASLNMGSVNFGETIYRNILPDIRSLAQKIKEKELVAELEIFDASMIETAKNMIREGLIPSSHYYNLNLGFPGALSANASNLCLLASMICEDELWGIVVKDRRDFLLLAAAVGSGATVVRVGFEDSAFLTKGDVAATNADLVRAAADLIRNAGLEPASPDEARSILHAQRARPQDSRQPPASERR